MRREKKIERTHYEWNVEDNKGQKKTKDKWRRRQEDVYETK